MIVLYYLVRFYELILIVRIILSWVHPLPNQPVIRIIYSITEPVLEPIRRLIPIQGMGIDFSPIIVFVIIEFITQILAAGL